ncbi:Hydroxyethylthiazole kinase [Cellulomonas flavigena DSM 20109]|uniref:Hydroxyethylthiazole kinase n=1 Tax=Cellulomonas flavigena (strain ATCC 482 / DSM 20109 / BCRC 11376 / JCM 18109 / NBRC 3775 / NCIMB 8073 / NRS 134) TaxID=446466 RepID=D5UDX4_CELFN|nr:hydroxyethylthiazole kinase [Cellulomonas flavigena]ADG74532.1 Hydroxyethylthiazole kinase [Cellulomonas flavigena DSM 20109]
MTSALPAHPADLAVACGAALDDLRTRTPLVQCLTNEVTTNLVANALLAVGASPAMASVPGEAEELAGAAGAVLVNLGTPGPDQRASMGATVAAASGAGVPWVLDPVAVGVLAVRTRLAGHLLAERPAVVRGNASEVRALAGFVSAGRGVDARDDVEAAADAADALARLTGGAVAVSGPVDLVSDARGQVRLAVGDPLLTAVTGAGCALGGLVAAFTAVAPARTAAVAATTALGLAAERAARGARGPASFQVGLVDELYRLTPADLAARVGTAQQVGVPA